MVSTTSKSVELKPLTLATIKSRFPNEWVLIGNPVMDENLLKVLSGIPLFHSKDKKEVAYFGREKVIGYKTFTVLYTGTFKPMRKIVTLYSPVKL